MKTSFLKKSLALLLALLSIVSVMTVSIGAAEAEPEAETQGIQVRIESVMRGYEDDMNLRSSELLVANVIGYKGNPQELTYEWTNTLGTYLYVYNSRNMYYINNTDGEIEIYNDKISPSSNMTSMGRSYENKFAGTGYCWAAIYGSNTSGANTSIADKNAYNGTISVTVKDKDGNVLGSDSHEGKVTTSGFWIWETTEYDGIVDHNLQADMDDVTIGIFEGDKRNVKDLLGESAILHITCVESTVYDGEVKSGNDYIELTGDAASDYYITGVKAGTSTDINGDAQVELSIRKNNCKFHENSSATATTTVYVFKKPTTSTTAYTLTLTGNIDQRCTYYINGNRGIEEKDEEGNVISVLFTGLNPNTSYQVEVRGHYTDENNIDRIAYAYVYDTTKPVYSGTVEVYLDGTYNSADHTVTGGTKVNLEKVSLYSTIYAKEINGTEFIKLEQKKDAEGNLIEGTYGSILDEGSYHLYYEADDASQIDQQLLTIHNADRTRYLFYNSVTYYDGSETDQKTQNFAKEYYVSESTVNTIAKVPQKEGYVFKGWKDRETKKVYNSSSLFTDHLEGPVIFDAVWEDAINVYIDFEINHVAEKGGHYTDDADRHNISFDLMSRSKISVGDYMDVFDEPVEIIWDGKSEFNHELFDAERNFTSATSDTTTYTHKLTAPILENTAIGSVYSVEVTKSGYEIRSVNTKTDEDGNVFISVKLQYEPKNGDLKFKVKLDEESEALVRKYPEYKPSAVHVKVLSWYTKDYEINGHTLLKDNWYHITQHHDTYITLYLEEKDDDIYAVGSYPVWMHNNSKTEYYYYRIKVVSYVLSNGTVVGVHDIIEEDNTKDIHYLSDFGRYLATIHVNNGDKPENSYLEGAHFNTTDSSQKGELVAEIHINTHKITFEPEGGKFSDGDTDEKVVSELIEVPDLSLYTPTREGGYVFNGWRVKDEQGQLVSAKINSGDELFGDITLYAEWKDPLTIEGDVFVAGYYYVNNDSNDVAIILEHDRTHAVTVYLQKLLANDYAETVDTQQVTVTYADANGENIGKPFGTASYSFTQVPDDGHDYRILIQNPNYIVSYQNEPESLDQAKINNFREEYSETKNFEAEYGTVATNIATINAFMRFSPHEFDLRYKVIASSIGKDYRPSMTEILIHCDDGKSGPNPQSWPVITQMADSEGNKNDLDSNGISVAEYDGTKTDLIKYPVWRTKTDGHNLYDYSVSLDSYTIGGTQKDFNAQEAPFYVSYNGSARYSAREDAYPEHQSQLLTVELTPKRYTITFKPGFTESTDDYITDFAYRVAPGQYEVSHIWSYETVIDEKPTRLGYKFTGWVYENDTPLESTTIAASVAENITLIATWEPLFTVTFHTNNDNVDSKGIFRVYYEKGNAPATAKFFLDENGKVPETYDLPALTDAENNLYIFKGWYLDPEKEDKPISWEDVYTTHTNVYAHWIKVESVQQDAEDLKKIPYADSRYPEYDLAGVQIRTAENDPIKHGGDAAPGLRFVAVLSERVYEELNTIKACDGSSPNLAKGSKYGFVIALTDTAKSAAKHFEVPEDEYRIQYCGENVNGKDTRNEFFYVENLNCSDYVDHCNYDDYRLYTSVITYEEYEDEELLEAQSTPITARPYLRYTDANGLLRTYYNNYTGKSFSFGGCSANYTSASENEVLKPAYEN